MNKFTYEQAEAAAKIIRQYINGEKVCTHYNSKEADEIFTCSYTLQEWCLGQLALDENKQIYYKDSHPNDFAEEYKWAHDTATYNYHMEEASCGLL